jgi:hypothetical protein
VRINDWIELLAQENALPRASLELDQLGDVALLNWKAFADWLEDGGNNALTKVAHLVIDGKLRPDDWDARSACLWHLDSEPYSCYSSIPPHLKIEYCYLRPDSDAKPNLKEVWLALFEAVEEGGWY